MNDHDQDLALISSNMSLMSEQEQKSLNSMELKHDALKANVRAFIFRYLIIDGLNLKLC